MRKCIGKGVAWHERVQTGGLDVAASLHRFVEEEALPGIGPRRRDAFWDGAAAIVHDLAPRNRRAPRHAATSSRPSIDDWHREHPGTPDPEAYTAFLREIGYLLDEPADVAVTTAGVDDEVATHRRPAARRPAAQRALRHQRGQRPLGLALRRPLRHRRRPARGRPRPRRRLQQGPRRRGHRAAAGPSSTSTSRSPSGSHADADVVRRGRRGSRRDASRTTSSASPTPAQLVGFRGRGRDARGRAAGPPRPARRDPGRPRRRDRLDRRGRGQGPPARVRRLHDHGPRGLGGRRRRRGQGARLPQLAAPHGGHPRRGGHQGRQDLHPRR